MLSLSLGLALSGVMLQGLMAEGQNGARLSRLMRERAAQRRTLELLKQDLAQALAVSTTPELEQHGCSLAGRPAVLHLRTAAGPITYSVGSAPSAIWRGRVLMRCGPAFGLEGLITAGPQSLNRVVIDGLVVKSTSGQGCRTTAATGVADQIDLAGSSTLGFSACYQTQAGLLALKLEQAFAQGLGSLLLHVRGSLVAQAPIVPSVQ
jgi:hypothetical protein